MNRGKWIVIVSLGWLGAACHTEEVNFVSRVALPLNSARPVFPVELGDSPSQAVKGLTCSQWNFRHAPDGQITELGCPGFRLEANGLEGNLYLGYRHSRLWFGIWEKAADWTDPELISEAKALDEKIRTQYHAPYSVNFNVANTEETEAAILRGEFHERWNLGNGIFYLWVGLSDGQQHSLVVQIKEKAKP